MKCELCFPDALPLRAATVSWSNDYVSDDIRGSQVRPSDWQDRDHKRSGESVWSHLDSVKLDTSKLEHLFESKSKEITVTKVRSCVEVRNDHIWSLFIYQTVLCKAEYMGGIWTCNLLTNTLLLRITFGSACIGLYWHIEHISCRIKALQSNSAQSYYPHCDWHLP